MGTTFGTSFGSEENADRVENYLRGSLSGEQLRIFEAQLLIDPGLRQEVDLQRKLELILNGGRLLDLEDRLKNNKPN